MEELEFLRKQIETIDEELIKLLNKRMILSKTIGDFKKKNKLPVFDPNREEQLKTINLSKVPDEFKKEYQEIFETILKVSKEIQL